VDALRKVRLHLQAVLSLHWCQADRHHRACPSDPTSLLARPRQGDQCRQANQHLQASLQAHKHTDRQFVKHGKTRKPKQEWSLNTYKRTDIQFIKHEKTRQTKQEWGLKAHKCTDQQNIRCDLVLFTFYTWFEPRVRCVSMQRHCLHRFLSVTFVVVKWSLFVFSFVISFVPCGWVWDCGVRNKCFCEFYQSVCGVRSWARV
jgi:hypothetical protein